MSILLSLMTLRQNLTRILTNTEMDNNFINLANSCDSYASSLSNFTFPGGGVVTMVRCGVGSAPVYTLDATTSVGPYITSFSNSNAASDRYCVSLWGVAEANSAKGYIGCGASSVSNQAFQGTFVIGTQNNTPVVFATMDTERVRIGGNGNTTPGADNTQTFGSASKRWSTIYSGTGTINTSDAREKTGVVPFTPAEIAAAKQLVAEIGIFQFLSAVQDKGESARSHIGLTVQCAIKIMGDNGLDPYKYGFICYDEWPEKIINHGAEYEPVESGILDALGSVVEKMLRPAWTETIPGGNRYSFRTDELLLFMARGFEARLANLEAMLTNG